jgi:hypothetical protein
MDRNEIRERALEYLYQRYLELGPEPPFIKMDEAEKITGIPKQQLGLGFRELAEDGLAEGHPRPGAKMHPEDGVVWLSSYGRRVVEQSRAAPTPPPVFRVVLDGFTPEGRQEFHELFSQVSAQDQVKFKQLLEELNDTSRSEEDRLDKAEKLVSMLQNSNALLGALLGPHVPQAISILQQFIHR